MDPVRILVVVIVAVICAVIVGAFLPGPAALVTFLIVLLLGLFNGRLRS